MNDDPDLVAAVKRYQNWGDFGENATLTVYDDIYKLGADIKKGKAYTLIISDLSMPNGSGLLLASTLRENHIDIPVIMLTGYAPKLLNFEGLFEIGVDGYVYSDNYGYRDLPNALKYYFYYRDKNNWNR